MIDGEYFVTPHAVRQFQSRVCALDYAAARAAIIEGLRSYRGTPKHLGGGAVGMRVRRPYDFRVVVASGRRGGCPAVVTVIQSGTGVTR